MNVQGWSRGCNRNAMDFQGQSSIGPQMCSDKVAVVLVMPWVCSHRVVVMMPLMCSDRSSNSSLYSRRFTFFSMVSHRQLRAQGWRTVNVEKVFGSHWGIVGAFALWGSLLLPHIPIVGGVPKRKVCPSNLCVTQGATLSSVCGITLSISESHLG